MKRKLTELNEYQAQLVTAVVGALISILVVAVPELDQYRDVLPEIVLLIVGLILGQSYQKSHRVG